MKILRMSLMAGALVLALAAAAEEAKEDFGLLDIDAVEPLRDAFNADLGSPRLVLLLSPT